MPYHTKNCYSILFWATTPRSNILTQLPTNHSYNSFFFWSQLSLNVRIMSQSKDEIFCLRLWRILCNKRLSHICFNIWASNNERRLCMSIVHLQFGSNCVALNVSTTVNSDAWYCKGVWSFLTSGFSCVF